jgi:DNA-binding Lrp family transcriptional regulator
VIEVNKVEGPYDIVAKLSDNNIDTIKESIGKHMTRIQGIQSTVTLISE